MATRAPFLNTPYGAYDHRHIPPEDEELLHVGPGTPCGDTVLRIPAAPNPEADKQLLCETGRKVAEDYIQNPPALRGRAT